MSLWIGKHKRRVESPSSTRTEAPMLRTLLDLTLRTSSIWLFPCILYNILYDQLVNISKHSSAFYAVL